MDKNMENENLINLRMKLYYDLITKVSTERVFKNDLYIIAGILSTILVSIIIVFFSFFKDHSFVIITIYSILICILPLFDSHFSETKISFNEDLEEVRSKFKQIEDKVLKKYFFRQVNDDYNDDGIKEDYGYSNLRSFLIEQQIKEEINKGDVK